MTKQIHKLFKNAIFLLMVSCFFLLVQFTCISMENEEGEERKVTEFFTSLPTIFSLPQGSNDSPSENSGASPTTSPTFDRPLVLKRSQTDNPNREARRQSSEYPNASKLTITHKETSKDKSSESGSDSAIQIVIKSDMPSTISKVEMPASAYNRKRLFRKQSSERPSPSKNNKAYKETLKEKNSETGSDSAIVLAINSDLPFTIKTEMASIIKKIEALTSDELECSYLAAVAYLIQNSTSHYDTAKVVIYSYPLFTSEGILFTLLTEFKETCSQKITAFLTQLVLEGFPNGIDHMRLALDQYNDLKKGLKLPPLLSVPLLNKLFAEPSESISLTGIDEENYIKLKNFNLANCDGDFVKKFADLLADKNISLLSAIKLEDMKSYLEDEKRPPISIAALEKHSNQVINWIAWQIVTQEDEDKRARLFQRFFFIGLAHKHNFCSATMIALALHKSVVKSLMSQKEKTNQNLVMLFELISPLKNNLNYRRLWSEFQIEGDCLPAFHILYQDAVTAFGSYKKVLPDDYQGLAGGLAGIAQILEPLSRCRTLSCSNSGDGFKFVWEFDEVSDEVLEEISLLRQQEIFQKQSQIPKELEKWTSEHFSSFLKQHNVDEKKIKKIEKKIKNISASGVCDGSAIIKCMGSPPQQSQRKKLEKLGFSEEMITKILAGFSSL